MTTMENEFLAFLHAVDQWLKALDKRRKTNRISHYEAALACETDVRALVEAHMDQHGWKKPDEPPQTPTA